MFKYIYRDMMSMVKHLPYGFLIGLPVATLLLWAASRKRGREGELPVPKLPVAAFGIYLSVMLVITFLSRESGDSQVVDLELFSTWGINDRNNAYVIENILLFVPFGFLGSWAFEKMRRFFRCLATGAFTSLCIESLQLVTGRGVFQIDDILTNTLGAVVGFLLYRLFGLFGKK